MTYNQAIEIINSKIFCKKKPNFSEILKVLEKFGNPQNKLKYVHIAGTNGKGTTSSYVASVLKKANYKVGLFTSPFIIKFTERFKINDTEISEKELIEEVELIEQIIGNNYELSFFEYITVIAFNWFSKQNCDIVVLEVGLGGKLDSTNIIEKSLVSAICTIGFDHTEMLGNTLSAIAEQKAGIIKQNGDVVLYPSLEKEAFLSIEKIAKIQNTNIKIASNNIEIIEEKIGYSKCKIDNHKVDIPFTGYHQILNCSLALSIIEKLVEKGFDISEENIKAGIKNAKLNGRIEIISTNPLIILDGGHNSECALALRKTIEKHLQDKKITAVIGMSSDKDYNEYLKILSPCFGKIIATKPISHRALDEKILSKTAEKYCQKVVTQANLQKAIELAISDENEVKIICGSLYLVGDVLAYFA
ncbi:MAG: folylpolyglutamate synthase/dihydrofolate synthase family protein [Clostridia bacterium]